MKILQEDTKTVKAKMKMYQDASDKRMLELDRMKAARNTLITSRDPWHQDGKDAKEHPTRKGFGWKAFTP